MKDQDFLNPQTDFNFLSLRDLLAARDRGKSHFSDEIRRIECTGHKHILHNDSRRPGLGNPQNRTYYRPLLRP
jgi:hypothetical protein